VADDRRLAQVLIEFAHTLVGDFSIQAILDHLVERVITIVPVTGAGVLLMSADGALRFVAASDEVLGQVEPLQVEFDEGPCIEAWRTGEQVLIPDLGTDQRFPQFSPRARESGLGAVFSFPMNVEGECLGALDVYLEEPGHLAAADVIATQVLADVAASYVLNSRNHAAARQATEELRLRTLHDELTGLPNRTLLHDRLEQAVAKAKRSGGVAAVLFVDLDRFKTINDHHGHHVGDQTLVAVADRLRRAVRPADTLARLAGDEFVIVCEELQDAATAENVAKRIADALARPVDLDGVGTVDVSASVGIAFAGRGTDLPEVILQDADAAMFEAKRGGGARYVIADESVRAQR
jgi:diguanylate cyclase (GGDEF)-like protein